MRRAHNFFDQFVVYHPYPWEDRDWARASGLPLEDVWFQAEDGVKLFGWYVESARSPAVLLWCHGNAGNIINRLDNLRELFHLGISVFLFDYRGYGRSYGRPSEKGLYQDSLAAYAYLTDVRHIQPEQIVLFGRSLGAAVAVEVASQRRAAGLILESAFPSVEALARFQYFGFPLHWLFGARFRLVDRLPKISVPILIIHGDRDDIVPLPLGKQVFDAAKEPKSFYLVPGANHNDLYHVGGKPYFQHLKVFVEKVVR
jgi:fermentation-respiration switch protein FrsA (DUF1100 family)